MEQEQIRCLRISAPDEKVMRRAPNALAVVLPE